MRERLLRQLPKDFWSSYSAMANGRGGWVILGVEEANREFTPVGVTDIEKVRTDLFNQLSDRDKVSVNLLSEEDVQVVVMDGKDVLAIHIPPATRKQKPVYLGKNPMGGKTYVRLHEGDRVCDEETVKRMLAEQLNDSRDNEVPTSDNITLPLHYPMKQPIFSCLVVTLLEKNRYIRVKPIS